MCVCKSSTNKYLLCNKIFAVVTAVMFVINFRFLPVFFFFTASTNVYFKFFILFCLSFCHFFSLILEKCFRFSTIYTMTKCTLHSFIHKYSLAFIFWRLCLSDIGRSCDLKSNSIESNGMRDVLLHKTLHLTKENSL